MRLRAVLLERRWSPQVRAAAVSVAVGAGILTLKVAAYLLTGSAAFLSDAAESVVNVVVANVALLSLALASRPPDSGHPYGHGKAEYLSGATEGVLVALAGAGVTATGLARLVWPVELQALESGLVLVSVAAGANFLTARHLMRVARQTQSLALEADARHLMADVLTSGAAIAGVGMVWATGATWLDGVVGAGVGLHIVGMGAGVLREAVEGLMDRALPEAEEARIREVLASHRQGVVDYHGLRTRRVGPQRFIDLHLVLHRTITVGEAHQLCDHLEEHVRRELPGADITIHVEPCEPGCPRCSRAEGDAVPVSS
jgi:cation diffusion facilitator family transporter